MKWKAEDAIEKVRRCREGFEKVPRKFLSRKFFVEVRSSRIFVRQSVKEGMEKVLLTK